MDESRTFDTSKSLTPIGIENVLLRIGCHLLRVGDISLISEEHNGNYEVYLGNAGKRILLDADEGTFLIEWLSASHIIY